MRLHKPKAGECANTCLIEPTLTAADILLMARQRASRRHRPERQLSSPAEAFTQLQILLEVRKDEVIALLSK